jgi:tetratricopeptide (TPR) repeat protein
LVILAGLLTQGTESDAQSEAHGAEAATQAFHAGDYSQAIALATEALEGGPGNVDALLVRARAEAALGRFDAAYAGFREALRRAPDDPNALYYLGVTAGVLAQIEYDRLLAQAPASARAHQLRAQSLEAQGKPLDAEAEYRAALEADPGLVEVLVGLGDLVRSDLAQSEERLADARRLYARALERAPEDYGALYGLGACDAFAGRHEEAVRSFRRASRVAPDAAPARLGLGLSLLESGRAEEAAAQLETATRLEPRMREAWYQLGRAYQSLGRAEDASTAFARMQELLREEREAREAMIDSRP